MRLTDLEPEFLKHSGDSWRNVDTLAEADGIMFLCPRCFETNHGNIGTHVMVCWRPSVPPEITPKPGRWEFEGTNFDNFTLAAGPSGMRSVLIQGGCDAHFYITNGEVTFA
jgi:hypothetical protein